MRVSLEGRVAALLHDLPVPVFFAGLDASKSHLMLHVQAGCDTVALRNRVASALASVGEPIQVSVCAHRLSQLAFPRSLEQWLARFNVGQVVLHDPTMIVSHARRLVAAVASCRAALGRAFSGSFFDPDRRTLFILARNAREGVPALQPRVAAIIAGAYGSASGIEPSSGPSPVNVRVVDDLPRRTKLVPVDARSASVPRSFARTVRRWLAPAALALAMSGAPAAASTNPFQVARLSIAGSSTQGFGVLSGLSVLSDGARNDAFAAMTLEWFFGGATQAGGGQRIQLAQKKGKAPDHCFDIKGNPTGADCAPFYTGS